jgi:CheY-like chemotaxis protein
VRRVLAIHRKPAIAAEYARRLSSGGLEGEAYPTLGPSAFRAIRANPPDAILIDLTELPSYGRTMAILLREQKSTRHIPLVFLKGDPAKAARVRQAIPDAVFATWPNIAPAVERAIAHAPESPALPGIAGIPLAQKLRIGEGASVALLHAPENIGELLGPLPQGAHVVKRMEGADVSLLFVRSAAALGRALPSLAPQVERGRPLWVCWPKRTSAEAGDLTLPPIREMASVHGLVDSKICAIDETWSGTALSRRR